MRVKVSKISKHIWSLKSWMLIPIHVWLVQSKEGMVLVDAGISNMAKGIVKAIEQHHQGELQAILLTHGHSDHVGAIDKIRTTYPVPVYAHHDELTYMEGENPYPRRKKAQQTVQKGLTTSLPSHQHTGALMSLFGLTPYHTPGHSPGHVVYYHHEDNVLLAGDLFISKKRQLHRPMPMFTADMKQAVKSSTIIEQLQPKRLEICHGEAIHHPAEQLDTYIQNTCKTFSIPVETIYS
ncbi:MBL fold metallo-hydrolase [Longirhabdus pacifica]|uniref:MBL fold metallo-hydrolase n=1 Tax=Longirhabdus pacifica TaxID=2305227 RepID=UPI0010087DF1|nr:MBL fold metallo-hydrolase [Longirhabdus pacifica]